jgi:hypothetical protein
MQESEFFLDWQIIAVTSDTILPIEWHSTAGSIRRRWGVSTVHGQLDMWEICGMIVYFYRVPLL